MERLAGVVCMAALVVITLANVLTRYFTNESFAWTEELSVFFMVILTLAGAVGAARKDGHLRIEAFYARPGMTNQSRLHQLVAVICAGFFIGLAILFARFTYDEIRYAETSMGLGIPRWWYSIWITPLCLLMAWRSYQVVSQKKQGDKE
jgi:TRAP-type transport system small permease protein